MGPFCFVTKVTERVSAILEPVVAALGYELWHLELEGRGHGQCLRLYIDAPAGIGLEDCERVSREASAALDVEDPPQAVIGRHRNELPVYVRADDTLFFTSYRCTLR